MTKNRKNTCKPRKRTTPTKAERNLAKRQKVFVESSPGDISRGLKFHKPGSQNLSK